MLKTNNLREKFCKVDLATRKPVNSKKKLFFYLPRSKDLDLWHLLMNPFMKAQNKNFSITKTSNFLVIFQTYSSYSRILKIEFHNSITPQIEPNSKTTKLWFGKSTCKCFKSNGRIKGNYYIYYRIKYWLHKLTD